MFGLLISLTTLVVTELLVRKSLWAWWASLANQGLWLGYIFYLGEWGLLPLNLAMIVQNIRGLRAWSRG